jgi:uncharacterized membrane protein
MSDQVADANRDALTGSTSTGVEPRLSALLCYSAWWVSGLIFLIVEQQHRAVRFHAAQSVVLFGGLSLVIVMLSAASVGMLVVSAAAFQAARLLVYLVWMGAVAIWMLLMLKTFQGETWRVPFASDLASRLSER